MAEYNFYKKNTTDKIWWVDNSSEVKGEFLFSFDRHQIFNLFADYSKLTPNQKVIFNKENPEWANFFSDRK